MNQKIPKIIHYCWFGGNPESELMKKCIASWERHLPDYELMLWNEKNFNINAQVFTKEAYEAQKWAFVSDYVRAYALNRFGGIYMDTDVEVVKPLDEFLEHRVFFGYENDFFISTGIIGSEKEHPCIKDILGYYDNRHFFCDNAKMTLTPNPVIVSKILKQKYGFVRIKGYQQLQEGIVLYPQEYFCPKSYYDQTIEMTENTYTIHHFDGSWHNSKDIFKLKMHKLFIALFGEKLHRKLLLYVHGRETR